ncbi:MAG: PKD domain-containing protein, partial [Bacteroidota bacterium]
TDPYPSTSSIPSVSGCTLRATTTALDFCLVEMSAMPDQVDCEPYWCGWNNSATPAANTTGIHHPMGDVKKICVDNDPPAIGNYGSGYDANSHWHIAEWDAGVTEGGSSGSALFDENHRVVGDLTGGQAACGYVFNDYYARFDRSWDDYTPTDQQLKYWLDPTNSGVTTLDGFDFYNSGVTANFSGTPTTIPVGSTVTFTDGSTPAGTITSWSWDFGGAGASPATQNTQGPHVVTYNTPGLYTITLTVSDGTNNDSETKTDYILVEDTVLNANFTASVTTVNVGGNVTFTDMSSPSAQIVSWDWNFGDPAAAPGQTANTQGPHVVTYNTVGFHTVTLTVGNGTSTDTETKTNYIEVIDPNAVNADFHASVTTLIAGQTTDFFDDSQNGPPVSWTWDFGNGTNSSVQNPTGIAYNTVGLYTVSLTVNDGTNTDNETKVDYIEVIDSTYLPVADFTSNFTTIFVNNTVDFYDMSSGSPNAWEWTFDGGTPLNSAVQDPTGVLYTTTGVYPVTLSVTNLLGSDTVTKTDYITVVDSSFISDTLFANFDVVGSRLIVQGATVLFVDLTIGYPTSWYWEFGSTGVIPTTSTDQHPSCQFTTPGFYDIMLIVSNGIVTDTLIKEDYIVVTSEPWPNLNGFCDTISNIQTGEFPLTFRHLAPAKWGYFPGHNEYTVRAYAEKFDNYMFSEVFGLIVPVVKAYEVSATSKVRFTVWDMDSLTGKPLNELDHKDLTVGSFTPYLYHTVEFDSPVPIPSNGKFFVGFQLYYDATAQDTFAVYMAPNRGIGGENTLYVKRPSWKLPSEVLGDTLNTSMAIELVGCLTISVEETDESGKIIIFPNPANDFLNVEFRDMNGSDANIAIIDMTGRMISTKTEDYGNGLYKINLQTLSDGIYFVTINLDGRKYTRKISVLR